MDSLIIYKSIHQGNTEKIAKAIKEELNAEMKEPEDIENLNLSEYDLICFGSGIYFRKHHKSILNFIDKLQDAERTKAFVFSTSGLPKIPLLHDFDKKINKKLKEKDFDIIGKFNCRGFEKAGLFKLIGGINKGRPNEKDMEKAKKEVKEALNQET